MNATLAVISGRALLHWFLCLALAAVLFWGAWRLIALVPNPTVKQILQIVWYVFLAVVCIDFLFGAIGFVDAPLIRY